MTGEPAAGGNGRAASEVTAAGREDPGVADTADRPVGDEESRTLARSRPAGRAGRRVEDPGALTGRNVRAVLLGIPSFGKLLWRLVRDPRVSKLDRALFGGALLYTLTPVDLVPDWLPVLGQLDDLVLIALVLARLLYRVEQDVLIEHWDGAFASLEAMEALLERLVDVLPWWARRLV